MLTGYTHVDDGLMDDTCLFTGDKASAGACGDDGLMRRLARDERYGTREAIELHDHSAACGDDGLVRRLALRQLLLMYGPKKL